jgi:dihydroxyacetone kinase-like predicted kinase
LIAVAAGAGMRTLLEAFGAYVVEGGPTLNPSPHELLRGIEDLGAPEAIVLPNSPNVILAAQQAAGLSDRTVVVVPCTSQQAALVALVEFDPGLAARENAERLNAALGEVRAGAVAPAAKPDAQGRFVRGDAVGFEGNEIVAWGGEGSTLSATIERLAEDAEIVTILQGADARIPLDELPIDLPDGVTLEVKRGGQPHYWWLIAAQ